MSNADVADLGALVKESRRQQRMTQAELAAVVGVSRQQVVAFEAGVTPEIGYSSVVRLMNAVGLDLRSTAFRERRRTFDEIVAEEDEKDEESYAPRM